MSISDPTLAEISMFGGNFNPRQWANCDGQLLPINSNQALFSLLGTTYGGDGRTSFGLPEMRGRVAVHTGSGPGLTPRQMGQKSGAETNTLIIAQMPSHGHAINAKAEGTTDDPNGAFIAGDGTNAFGVSSDVAMSNTSVANTGGGQAVNNMQPYMVVRYIIALQGVFPSRN
ncbi:MAG TPA: tail fiber protein [Aequorivita sp.]|nr:tail fiber protein [Aequorivita sp.]